VSPGYPPPPYRDHDDPAFSDPGSGPEVDDVRLVLDARQLSALRDASYHEPNYLPRGIDRHPLGDLTDAQVAEFALGVLNALGVESPDDDEFQEALGDGEPSEDDMRDAREDR